MEYSLDNGLTWLTATTNVRVIYRSDDAGFGDEGMQQLHVNLTSEGIILDVIDSDTGELVGTSSEMAEEVMERLSRE